MTKALNQALDAVANMASRPPIPDLHHGQHVVQLGGDGTVFIIKGFQRAGRGRYLARLMREDCIEINPVPVHFLKPADQPTLH